MIVVVCPGQGSQKPGFLTPWLEHDVYRQQLEGISQAIGIDLIAHGTVSDSDTIRNTAIAQPLIVAAGLLTLSTLLADGRRERIGGVAGHSVGEVTAAVASGVLTPLDAMILVNARAQAMADAAALEPTGMSAVVGADEDELMALLTQLDLEPANFNGGGQIVVAGALDGLEKLRATPPARARVIPLQVAGAFHTRYMAPAVERLREVASTMSTTDPTVPLWSNHAGERVTAGADYLSLIVGQMSSPVRWDRTMASLHEAGVTGIVEVAPAGALVGLAKRGLTGVPAVAVTTPDDLAAAIELIDGNS